MNYAWQLVPEVNKLLVPEVMVSLQNVFVRRERCIWTVETAGQEILM